jgi:hypothetical protein
MIEADPVLTVCFTRQVVAGGGIPRLTTLRVVGFESRCLRR